jgi:hypothetical protein
MAVKAKDGTVHHSASRALLHDEMAQSRGKSSGVVQKKDSADKGPGQPGNKSHEPGPTETPIQDHVEEHGPAHTVHYSHDEATGKHTVTSYHGDAKPLDGMGGGDSAEGSEHMNHPGVHHSVHKTKHAAHEHMGKSMGMDHENEDSPEEPDDETPDSQQDQMAGSRGIPGLS